MLVIITDQITIKTLEIIKKTILETITDLTIKTTNKLVNYCHIMSKDENDISFHLFYCADDKYNLFSFFHPKYEYKFE